MAEEEPRATETLKEIYQTTPLGIKVHTGQETIRKAWCRQHQRYSVDFVGLAMNDDWIFKCAGRKDEAEGLAHWFTAKPPVGAWKPRRSRAKV